MSRGVAEQPGFARSVFRIRSVWRNCRVFAVAVSAIAFVACNSDDPQVPTTLTAPTTSVVSGTVATIVSSAPTVTVKDQKGRGIANIWVHWSVGAGGGHVANDSARTDANGLSLSGGWTLGTTAGEQTLTATANSLPTAIFRAQAVAGAVQSLVVLAGAQSGIVNVAVTTAPSIRAVDQYGNAVQGLAITFNVLTGGGTLTGTQQTTNADGVATLGAWTLGTASGDQSVRAVATASGISATFIARAIGGAAASMTIVEGDAQRGSFGKRLCISPSVRVVDAFGNGIGSVPVSFTPAAGSGSVSTSTVLSDATTGRATVGAWTLGANASQTLVATSSALPGKQLVFSETAATPPGYSICARFIGDGGTARQREAVVKAVTRWQSVITAHVASARGFFAAANECTNGIPAINEDVEDLLLYILLTPIDGRGGILGQSAPCYIYSSNGLTLMGFVQLDVADADQMVIDGTIDNVFLHEIGHILGIGTLWDSHRSLLNGRGSLDPFFSGAVARDQFSLTGSSYSGTPVPVENSGGVGTRDSHWRKTIFGSELMQGYAAPVMPLSKVTIGSLADLGYTVNLGAADPFSLLPALRADDATPGTLMANDVSDSPMWMIGADGSKTIVRIPTNPFRR